jgi:spore coat protein U-like protein
MTQRQQHTHLLIKLTGCAILFVITSNDSLAATYCTFTSVSPVSFGVYDVFAASPNNNGVGSITIDCKGAGNHTFDVTLSEGRSHNYASRAMKSGINQLNYNLYTSAARNEVWGDGTGTSQVMVYKNQPTTLSIFGQITAGQDVGVGIYADNITAIVNF